MGKEVIKMPGPMGARRQVVAPPVKDFKKTTKKLIKNYLSKYKIALIIVMIFAIRKYVIYDYWT